MAQTDSKAGLFAHPRAPETPGATLSGSVHWERPQNVKWPERGKGKWVQWQGGHAGPLLPSLRFPAGSPMWLAFLLFAAFWAQIRIAPLARAPPDSNLMGEF